MDSKKIMNTSILVFIIVFLVTLGISYQKDKQDNKELPDHKFNLQRYGLLSLAIASGAALISCIYFNMQAKSKGLKFGCGACSATNKMKIQTDYPFHSMKYNMQCGM